MVKKCLVACLACLALFAKADDEPDLSMISIMRSLYEDVAARGEKVRTALSDRIAEARKQNNGHARLDEFREAERIVRVREPLPQVQVSAKCPTRVWKARKRLDGYEPRSAADNYVAGPESEVILFNRELTQEVVDLSLPGRGDLAFIFRRTYHSNLSYDGPLGCGWDHSYNIRLEFPSEERAELILNGRAKYFVKNGEVWESEPGNFYQLKLEGKSYRVYSATLARMEFERSVEKESTWRLKAIAARHDNYTANRIELTYADSADLLVGIKDPMMRHIVLSYNEDGRISQISSDVDAVSYEYDNCGNLISVKGLPVLRSLTETAIPCTRYSYSTKGERNLLVSRKTDGEEKDYVVEYDLANKVLCVGYKATAALDARWRFAENANCVEVKPPAPSALVRYGYEPSSRVRDLPRYHIVPSMGATNEFAYSASGLLVFSRDAIGCVKKYQYDEGNLNPCSRKNVLTATTLPRSVDGKLSVAKIEQITKYGPGNSFPLEDIVVETSEDGTIEELSSSKYVYNKDWVVTDSDENGLKTRMYYNRYGNMVVRVNGVGGSEIFRYADGCKCFDAGYVFVQGSENGDGPLCSMIEDATDGQIDHALKAIGEPGFHRHAFRVAPVSRETFYSYDRYGNLVCTKRNDKLGLELCNREGETLASYAPQGGVQIIGYTSTGKKAGVFQEIGNEVLGSCEGLTNDCFSGRFVSSKFERDALGMVTAYEQNAASTGCPKVRFEYRRYASGKVKDIINPLGVVRSDSYDASTGLLNAQILTCGKLSQTLRAGLVYDVRGEPVESEDSLGEKTFYEYDKFGRRTSVRTPDGIAHKTTFDGLERVVTESANSGDAEISFKKFQYGFYKSQYGAYGKLESSVVDRIAGRERESMVAGSRFYDAAGQIVAERGQRNGAWTYYLIDGLGRRVATMLPSGEYKFVIYDGDDVLISATWPCSAGRIDNGGIVEGTIILRDGAGNPTCSMPLDSDWKPIDAQEVVSGYDCQGYLIHTQSKGQTDKTLIYDALGRVVLESTKPLSQKHGEDERRVRYEYLLDGQLKRKIVGNNALVVRDVDGTIEPSRVEANQVLEYKYDQLGRSIEICQPDGLIVKRKYDKHSMPVEMTWCHLACPTNVLRRLELRFGKLGRLSEIRNGLTGDCLQKYGYDVYGNVTCSIDCGGDHQIVVNRQYDSLGNMLKEETIVGGHRFPIRYAMDPVRGKKAIDLNEVFAQPWARGVSESNWRRQEESMDVRGRVVELRLARQREPFKRMPFASWKYRGSRPVERMVPSSYLKTVNSYDSNGMIVSSEVLRNTQRFGVMSYAYDELANLIGESTFLYENAAHKYESAQYFDYSAYRQLVAQNVESNVRPKEAVEQRRDEVLNGTKGSLQATKTSRMAYDQAENLWAEYSGKNIDEIQPDKLEKSNLIKMLSSATVVTGRQELSEMELRELASNREVTRATYSGEVLKAEMNEYDRLGCLRSYDGEYWNGVREYPVKWTLEYDVLGRLSEIHAALRERVLDMAEGENVANLRFAYDAGNRRIRKEVEDKSRPGARKRVEWTIYDGNNQVLVFAEEGSVLRLREQYLWNGNSRELVMASLPEGDAENVSSAKTSRYYFQQDRGLNTVCVTKAEGGMVSLVSGVSYLGFGKNSTVSSIVGISTSLGYGVMPETCYNSELDDGKDAVWEDKEGVQYAEIKLSENANLTELAIWTDEAFPSNLVICVLPPHAKPISQSVDASMWLAYAEHAGYFIDRRQLENVERGRPVKIPLFGVRGNRVSIVWQGEAGRSIKVREFEVLRRPNNPGSIAYAGQWLDRETGLYYQINRYKLAGSNKFISPDPIGFMDGNNIYAYAKNNPLEWHDPNGEWAHVLLGAVSGAVLNSGVYAIQCWITGEEFSWKELAVQAGIGAIAGGVAAATFGAVNPFLASHGFNAAANIVITGAASGLTSGFASGTSGALMHGATVSDALTAGAKEGGWGMLGGAIGGGVVSKLGASFGSTVLSGAVAGGTVSGLRNTAETYMDTGDWAASFDAGLTGIGKGVVGGAAISAAGWGVGRATGMIKPLKGYPDHLPDPRQKGIMIKTKAYDSPNSIPKPLRPFKSLLSYRDQRYDGVTGGPGDRIHHIKPVSLGGTTTKGNLTPVPVELHSGPGNMHPGSYVKQQPIGTIFY